MSKTLEDLNSRDAFNKDILNQPYFKYFVSNRFNGEIKAAGASRDTLMKDMDERCWEVYEILTRRQYLNKWGKREPLNKLL